MLPLYRMSQLIIKDMLEQLIIIASFIFVCALIMGMANVWEYFTKQGKQDLDNEILDLPVPLFLAEGRMANGSRLELWASDFDELLDMVSNEYSDDELDKESVYYFEEVDGERVKVAFP